MKTPAKDIVTRFIESLNQEDFDTALTLLHSNMTFEGVLGTRKGLRRLYGRHEKNEA